MPGSLVGDRVVDLGGPVDAPAPGHVRAALRVSQASVASTFAACAAAVVAGAADGSLVLIAFGLTGLLDGAASLALVLHFRHALAHQTISSDKERLALRVVSIGLIVIGGSTVVESARRLIAGQAGHGSPAGAVIAAASIVVLATLAIAKRRIGRLIRSDALRADGWLSGTGAMLAAIALGGAVLTERAGVAWLDAVAALIVAGVATGIGVVEARRESSALSVEDQP